MFAIAAAFAFLIALVLNIVAGHQKLMMDFLLVGGILVSLHLAFYGWSWYRWGPR
jgi:hypothetical protein